MPFGKLTPVQISLALGALSLALVIGAMGFQYIGHYAPCEVCHWQRWPHVASAIVGIGGAGLIAGGLIEAKWARTAMFATIVLVALAGLLGVYHAGVEWGIWGSPPHCSGPGVVFTGLKDLNDEPVVRCDKPALWIFGITLAGYNALISLGAAAAGMMFGRNAK